MKFCPNCRTQYTDDTLQYCLQDGTPLSFADDAGETPTVIAGETETVVSPKINEPLRFDLPQNRPTFEQNRTTNVPVFPPEPKKSNAFLIVLATAFAMLLLFGIVGTGAWFYFRNQGEIAKNTSPNQNSQPNSNTKPNANKSPSPTASPWVNIENSVNATPEKTPLPPVEKEKIKTDVVNRINNWKSDGEAIDLDNYMQNYAPTVDYYNKKGATAAQVRSDKLRAFNQFDSISIDITNLTVTPDATGETATAVFDKEWFFESDIKSSSGKVRQELRLRKINNKWLIAGERDLKLYYKN